MIDLPIDLRFSGRRAFFPFLLDPLSLQTLVVAVTCRLHGLPGSYDALFDTGAQWSILPTILSQQLGFDRKGRSNRVIQMSTRHGLIRGSIEELDVRFPTDRGGDLDLSVSFLVPYEAVPEPEKPDLRPSFWPGPIVLGWTECLELFRHALDPSDDSFYFGPLIETDRGSIEGA